jgi:putative membrane protein
MPGRLWLFATAAWLGVGTITACKDRGDSGTRSGAVGAPAVTDTGPAQPADQTAMAGGALTDVNIVALLDEANEADSAAGAYALTKATNPEVKAFAKLMMGEHHALRAAGQQLAKKLNVTPQPPADDPVQPLAKSEMAALRAAPKGPEFDRTYIDQEIAAHKAVLDLVDKAHDQAKNEELKALIEQAKPVIEKHLAKAEEIQKKLGGPTA